MMIKTIQAEQITSNLRLSGLVKRYHTWPVLREQNTAEHSWHVYRIFHSIFGIPHSEITRYIMFHDCPEIYTGDIPFPLKRNNPDLAEAIRPHEITAWNNLGLPFITLSSLEKKQIALCHTLEMYEYGLEEFCRGNRFAEIIGIRCASLAVTMTYEWFKEKDDPPKSDFSYCDYDLNTKVSKYMLSFEKSLGLK